jgi:hypothetical protein
MARSLVMPGASNAGAFCWTAKFRKTSDLPAVGTKLAIKLLSGVIRGRLASASETIASKWERPLWAQSGH